MDRVVEWQLGHPEQDRDACATWLKEEQAAGRLAPAGDFAKEAKRSGKQDGKPKKKAKISEALS